MGSEEISVNSRSETGTDLTGQPHKIRSYLLLGTITLGATACFGSGVLHYLGGRYPGLMLLGCGVFGFISDLGLPTLVILCVAKLFILLKRNWRSHNATGRLVRLAVIATCIIGMVVGLSFFQLPNERFAQGFRSRILAKADIAAIRAWQEQLGASGTRIDYVDSAAWPACVKTIHPRWVRYRGDDKGVNLSWGGGFLSTWGLMVGPLTMVEEREESLDGFLSIGPGVYVYKGSN